MRRIGFGLVTLSALTALTNCAGEGNVELPRSTPTSSVSQALDDVNDPPKGVSLLVLDPSADRVRVTRAIEESLHGTVYQILPPRLIVARMTTGIDAILRDLGVRAHYERVVDPTEIPLSTLDEQRFVRVFDNRFYPSATPKSLAITPKKVVVPPGTPFEAPASEVPAAFKGAALKGGVGVDPNDHETTPFASGTVVVSLLLPESNGIGEPSTEDWNEDLILETYQKVNMALEAIERTEPNAKLRFIVHYESAPAHGGLPGTIDCDYEFGKHADFGFQPPPVEDDLTGQLLSKLLGHQVNAWDGAYEYLNGLRARYGADGAYFIKIAPNANLTAYLRAHAFIGGPSFTINTSWGWDGFMHEQGHIFGALDEYCPDACTPPNALGGYLGVPNANATYYQFKGGPGYKYGGGEDQSSLMKNNDPDGVNGWTRGAWGWLDDDADGLIDVRDTTPRLDVTAQITGDDVHLVGTVEDAPATHIWDPGGRSFNTVDALQIHFGWDDVFAEGSWFDAPLTTPTKGLTSIDLDLGKFPHGQQRIVVRAKNSVGNVSAMHKLLIDVSAVTLDAAPWLRLDVSPKVGSPATSFSLRAHGVDLDVGDFVEYRFDLDGDGRYETPWSPFPFAPAFHLAPGVKTLRAQARDRHGVSTTASFDVLVREKNALPEVSINAPSATVFGNKDPHTVFSVGDAFDPDGDALEYSWVVEGATSNETLPRTETKFSADNTSFALPSLGLPVWLRAPFVDFNPPPPPIETIVKGPPPPPPPVFVGAIQQVVQLTPTIMVAAADRGGLYFVDLSVPNAPKAIAHLDLETNAHQLVLDGTRLYVLGGLLTVVDVSDPTKPVEIKQRTPVHLSALADDSSVQQISDGGKGTSADLFPSSAGKIDDVRVDVEIDHPAWEELTVTLQANSGVKGGGGAPIVLWDHQRGSGHGTMTFTVASTPALSALVGQNVASDYFVRVADTVTDDPTHVGTYDASHLSFSTTSYAVQVVDRASTLLGALEGRYVVVAGTGLQILDAQSPDAITQAAFVTAPTAFGGALSGSTAIVAAASTPKVALGADAELAAKLLAARGLYAVDLTTPTKPKVKRSDLTVQAASVLVTGRRMFVTTFDLKGSPATTFIGDVKTFVNGGSWQLGKMPQAIAQGAFGDDRSLWDISQGRLQRFDVSTPSAPKLALDYPDPIGVAMSGLGGDRAALFDNGREGSSMVRLVGLRDEMTPISGVYRVTLQARDTHGEVSTVTRTIHVVPYDHAPSLDSVVLASGAKANEDFAFTVHGSDLDQGTTFDPNGLVRVDFDDDGAYDATWSYVDWITGGGVHNTYTAPGHYVARFELRDQFRATSQKVFRVTVQ